MKNFIDRQKNLFDKIVIFSNTQVMFCQYFSFTSRRIRTEIIWI